MPTLVVFTGTLSTPRAQQVQRALDAGFLVGSKVTSKTTLLVCGKKAGAKRTEAEMLGIEIIDEQEWESRFADEPKSTNAASKKRGHARDVDKVDVVTNGVKKARKASLSESSQSEKTGADSPLELIQGPPLMELQDGETRQIQSKTSSSVYTIKRTGDVYMCSCLAWKNQRTAITHRTCKHLKETLSEEFERTRTNGVEIVHARTVTGQSKSQGPKLLLAHVRDPKVHDPVGWWMSEKLDGVRAYWDAKSKQLLSRLGHAYLPPDWFMEGFPNDIDLDGELFLGRGEFQSLVSVVKTAGTKRWADIIYKVFDAPTIEGGFETRLALKYAVAHDHVKCKSTEDLDAMLQQVQSEGGEGLMIRMPGSLYAHGRSNTLLKIKTFHDGEAVVIGYEKGKGKYKDMTGALKCRMACGKEFKVASGMKDVDRSKPPKVGAIISYKCQELTKDGIPRFPIYLGIAIDKDQPADPKFPIVIAKA